MPRARKITFVIRQRDRILRRRSVSVARVNTERGSGILPLRVLRHDVLLRPCPLQTTLAPLTGQAVELVALLAGATQSLPGHVAALVGGRASLVDIALDQRVDEREVGEHEGHEGLAHRPES